MFKRKLKYEVVPESAYTDYSDRYAQQESKPSVSNGALVTAGVAATASLATMAVTKYTNPTTTFTPPIPLPNETTVMPEPTNVLTELSPVFMSNPEIIPTGLIADKSLNMLATALDPVIQILVAISFPIASVVMIGACFFFMFGNSERAWNTIMNAGLGYVLIQMSPLFLEILRQIGKAI
ncbi:hypothetical protein [Sporosarcina sp. ITBMC105]